MTKKDANYEYIIAQLKKGGMPTTTGMEFTSGQATKIKNLLDARKKQLDDYYRCCVATRVSG